MAWFTKLLSTSSKTDMPSLAEVWQHLAPRYEASVEVRGPESVRVTGTARGRALEVDIESRKKALEELHRLGNTRREKQVYRTWSSRLAVGCANPQAITGTIKTFRDTEDPSFDVRNRDFSHCRKVVGDGAAVQALVTDDVVARLMRPFGDTEIHVTSDAVYLGGEKKANADMGYFGGCDFHINPAGDTTDQRFFTGPPWWIDLLCDIADMVDSPTR